MQDLEQLLQRITTYQEMLIYNKKVVDPYLLASHGLSIDYRNHQDGLKECVAVCSGKNCSLVIEFDHLDGEEEVKDDLETVVFDHDMECPFNQKKPLYINYSLLREIGHTVFEARVENIQKHQKFIQLSPKEIKIALNLRDHELEVEPKPQVNITLEMFRKLDKRLNGEKLVKVKSIIFLAVFGWEFSEASENELICHFCANTKNVFEFISPSECTLMSLPNGFEFISAHKPWCCLIQQKQPLWREILKQTVIHQLSAVEGQICKSESEMKCKEIQDNAIKSFTKHFSRWSSLKRKLDEFKINVESSYAEQSDKNAQIKQSFGESISHLDVIFDNCREQVQKFIKRIKIN